jgi:hypothetical protein
MGKVEVLDYFCRVEGEELVCVARLRVNGRYLQKEFKERLAIIEATSGDKEGVLGC